MRILAERHPLSPLQRELVVAGLNDPDAFVRRTAADALGSHPASENVPPLLAARQAAPAKDPQLVYTIRVALRNQLRDKGAMDHLPSSLN